LPSCSASPPSPKAPKGPEKEGSPLFLAAYYGHEFDIAENTLREALQIANGGFDDTRLFASVQLSSLFMVTGRHNEAAALLKRSHHASKIRSAARGGRLQAAKCSIGVAAMPPR
jgi:hypothetical protein